MWVIMRYLFFTLAGKQGSDALLVSEHHVQQMIRAVAFDEALNS